MSQSNSNMNSSAKLKESKDNKQIFTGEKIRNLWEQCQKKLDDFAKQQQKYQKDLEKYQKDVEKFNEQNKSQVDKMRDNFNKWKEKATSLYNKPYGSNVTLPGQQLPKSVGPAPENPDAYTPQVNKVASYMYKLGSEHILLMARVRQNTIKLASVIKELEDPFK